MRVVVKIGTSTLTHTTGQLNIRLVEEICKTISDVKNAGNEVIIVSSGAIGMGVGKLGLPEKPADIQGKQAAAAVGQCELMYTYDKLFGSYHHTVAQVLMTSADFNDEGRYQNFINTMQRLLDYKALPIVNENDTVATDEISLGDNDTLGGIVAKSMNADLLIVLSDIEGLYTANPHESEQATVVPEVFTVSNELLSCAGGTSSTQGTGGMVTKLSCAQMCEAVDCAMAIINGKKPHLIYDLLEGKPAGTRFMFGMWRASNNAEEG